MSSMVEVIRSVVRRELAAVRGPALGVVTDVHPHTGDNDDFNEEVDVRLQYEDAQLARVPVAVGLPGAAAVLEVGDLVLVQFLGGDLQQPFVTGSFHTADARPPVRTTDNHIVEQRVDGKPRNRLTWDKDGALTVERLNSGGSVVATVLLDADGNVSVTADKKDVTIKCATFTVQGHAVVDGGNFTVKDGTVTATHSSKTTTIDGNTITGS